MPKPLSEITDALRAAIAPANLVRKRATRLCRGEGEIVLVGTLHWRHLGRARLKVGFFRSLIEFYAPDKVGIEARPRDLDAGLVGLAPIDMAYIWAITKSMRIPVFGFDWWSEEEYEAVALADSSLDFNSASRNDRMVELILAQIAATGRHLLFAGYSHVNPIRDRLLGRGFSLDSSFGLDMDRLICYSSENEQEALRPMLRPHLLRSIEHLDQYLHHLRHERGENKWTRRVRQKRNRLVRIVEASAVSA